MRWGKKLFENQIVIIDSGLTVCGEHLSMDKGSVEQNSVQAAIMLNTGIARNTTLLLQPLANSETPLQPQELNKAS